MADLRTFQAIRDATRLGGPWPLMSTAQKFYLPEACEILGEDPDITPEIQAKVRLPFPGTLVLCDIHRCTGAGGRIYRHLPAAGLVLAAEYEWLAGHFDAVDLRALRKWRDELPDSYTFFVWGAGRPPER